MDREKLIKSIMADAIADGEPLTRAEAEEIADMEIKAKGVKNYTQSAEPQEKKVKERKVDTDKQTILEYLKKGLTLLINSTTIATETETKLHFSYNGCDYTVMLTKHRPKK